MEAPVPLKLHAPALPSVSVCLQVVVKDVGGSFDAFGFAFLRFAVAAAAFSPFLKVRCAS